METSSKKVLEALPDFDDYMKLAGEIKNISYERMLTENAIKAKEAEIFRTVMTDPKYFTNGKAVPVSYFDNAYKFSGLNGELLDMRSHLADMVSELELKRSQFEVFGRMHDLYKALSYAEKNMS